MTPDRLREIVAAVRGGDPWPTNPTDMHAAFLVLADLAGIGQPDADLDGFEARAHDALRDSPEPWEANPEMRVYSAPGVNDELGWEIGPDILAADGTMTESVAQHIAGAHPAAVLTLVARCRRAEAQTAAAIRHRNAIRTMATYRDTPSHMRGPLYDTAKKELDDSFEAMRALGVEP